MSAIEAVYIIYSADILGSAEEVERMGPVEHLPAGYEGEARELRERIAAKFVETEGDEQYDYGYLADESERARYFPAGFVDREGLLRRYLVETPLVTRSWACMDEDHAREQHLDAHGGQEDEEILAIYVDDDSECVGEGRHRKWVGELSPEEWEIFAESYFIDLDAQGMPERYEDTMGSITEHGHIPAVAVDNSEGWTPIEVIDSQFYISIALRSARIAELATEIAEARRLGRDPQRMTDMKIIYVVAFTPDFTGWHGDTARVGGFDWFTTREAAEVALHRQLDDGDTGHDLLLRSVAVPRELDGEGLTDWINEREELWNLPIPKEWVV